MFEISEIKSNKRRVFLSAGVTFLTVFLFILFLPTIILLIFGGYELIIPTEIYAIKSPNNKYVLSISKRVGIPVFSPIDPSGVVNVSLKDTSNNEIDSFTFDIHEYNELTEPTITWKTNEVLIENIDYHKEFSFKIPLPNN